MASIHSASTRPELRLRRALWHLGLRYRVNDKKLPGKPDIVLTKYRTVVFIHGCFWHGHKGCKYYTVPATNTQYWVAKVDRNQERDQEVWRQLEAKGWSVIIVWECELKKTALEQTICRVQAEIIRNGEAFRSAQEERRRTCEAYRLMRKQQREKDAALLLTEIKER